MKLEDEALLAEVASMYHLDQLSRVEIAAALGISRFKVSRLLEAARDSGVVAIEVRSPGPIDTDLSIAVQQRFGLARAIAVTTPSQQATVVDEAIGEVAADLLAEIVTDGDVVGIGPGAVVQEAIARINNIAPCDVVQLAGVLTSGGDQTPERTRHLAATARGRASVIQAPMLTADPQASAALRRDPAIAETLRRQRSVTTALVTVGSWAPPDSALYDAFSGIGLIDTLLAHHIAADVCGVLLDQEGNRVDTATELVVGISAQGLRKIPDVIAVAGGPFKTDAIRSALASGLVRSLVTDCAGAHRLLGT